MRMEPKTVKITRAHEDTYDILKEAVKDSGLRGKRRIFVKPNLSHPEYVPGVVTCPELIREMVGLLRNGAEEVVVGKLKSSTPPRAKITARSITLRSSLTFPGQS